MSHKWTTISLYSISEVALKKAVNGALSKGLSYEQSTYCSLWREGEGTDHDSVNAGDICTHCGDTSLSDSIPFVLVTRKCRCSGVIVLGDGTLLFVCVCLLV